MHEQAIRIHRPESLATVVRRYREALEAYQDRNYANAYMDMVARAQAAEQALHPGGQPRLALAVAHSLYKLMAYKDEYEVARLFTDAQFRRELAETFEGDYMLRFHLAPPLLARRDPSTGRPRKMSFGPKTEAAFRLLARCKGLRGTWLDPFGHTAERRLERQLVKDYQAALQAILARLDSGNYVEALGLASLPQEIRGFGPVKEESARACQAQLRAALQAHRPADGRGSPVHHARHA